MIQLDTSRLPVSMVTEEGGEEYAPFVFDNGSGLLKCGTAGEDQPKAIFDSLLGHPKHSQLHGGSAPESYVGPEAMRMRGIAKLSFPVEKCVVSDWDAMEKLWDYALYSELRYDDQKHPLGAFHTEVVGNPKYNRERACEIWFETFGASRYYVAPGSLLAMFACGRTTGVSLDMGHGLNKINPVYEGYSMPHAFTSSSVAGAVTTARLERLLMEQDLYFTSSAERQMVNEIKKHLCYVAVDFASEPGRFEGPRGYSLPDGTRVTVGDQQYRAPEVRL